ncbi:carboxylesterase/lipase family protein [Rhodococcus koreensis]
MSAQRHGSGGTRGRHTPSRPVVDTAGGRVRGTTAGEVSVFKGIPYGNVAGGSRFRQAVPARWTGIRDSDRYGPSAPQVHPGAGAVPIHLAWIFDTERRSEDCLVLNVFAPADGGRHRAPVMVFFHGGGFANGSASPIGLDGRNLARRGIVVVSINHRLNVFGHLFLGLDDERYADSGNIGLLDVVLALRWVRENISQFGGDPCRVTIFGQSGGGSKVAGLMAMPAAEGLFHRAIIQSASSALRFATIEEAARNTHHLLEVLQIDQSRLHAVADLPGKVLLEAVPATIAAAGGVDNFRPVIDGRHLPAQPFADDAIGTSSDIPLLMGWCETEQRAAFSLAPENFTQTWGQALERVGRFLDVPRTLASTVMSTYADGRPQDSPGDVMALVYGDHRYRRTATRAAELRVAAADAATYVYLVKWRSPVLGGSLRSPHMLCLPFVFRNVDHANKFVGTEPDRYRLQDEMSQAWVAFARTGSPDCAELPRWPRYSLPGRPTMVFDRHTAVEQDPAARERAVLESCPPYLPAEAEGGRRR